MNELDKQSPIEEDVTRDEVSAAADAVTNEAVAEAAAVCENECAEQESPALSLAEAADEQESVRNYHDMTKQEMKEALQEILNAGNMEAHKEVAAIKQAFYIMHNREINAQMEEFVAAGNAPESFSVQPDEMEAEMKALLAEFREKRSAYLEQKEEQLKKNLEEKNKIVAELKALADDIDNINLHFPKFQQLQQDFKAAGNVPPGSDAEVWKNYQTAVEQFYDRWKMNKELRDLDFKKNLELKNALIQKARELAEVTDVVDAFKRLQVLHEQWREIGPVARELRDEIWNQFKEASTVINKLHQDFFQNRKANEQANEDAKTAICEKIEAIDTASLHNFNEWDAATKEVIAMQQEWKGLGFASKKTNAALFNRFRKDCDDFFAAKAEYFKKSKEENKENLSRKEALCEKAEALVERFAEKSAFDELQALQAEWRTVGMVRRKAGDEVWKRFRAAVDAFYDARKKLINGRRDEETENLKAKKDIIGQLKAISEESERREVIGTIRSLQEEWQKIGHVPFKQKDAINKEYRAELDRLYGAFDVRESRQRMRRFEGDLKKMEGDGRQMGREREKLVRALEARQAEIKTIENNLGFFKFSSASNPMVKDFERKIQKLNEDVAQIKEKIALLDKQESASAE